MLPLDKKFQIGKNYEHILNIIIITYIKEIYLRSWSIIIVKNTPQNAMAHNSSTKEILMVILYNVD